MCASVGLANTGTVIATLLTYLQFIGINAYPNEAIDRLSYGFMGYDPAPVCVISGYVPDLVHFRLKD